MKMEKSRLDALVLAALEVGASPRWALAQDIGVGEGEIAASLRRLREASKARFDRSTGKWSIAPGGK